MATYCDGAHWYLFTVKNKTPKVLVNEAGRTAQGQWEFKETQNMDLRNGFAKIVQDLPSTATGNTKDSSTGGDESGGKTTADTAFDQLSPVLQALLAAQIVDDRISEYYGLEGMYFSYALNGGDLYVNLTSGAGSGHPIYHLSIDSNGVTLLQGVSYLGAQEGYGEFDVPAKTVTKTELYQHYQRRKAHYDQALTRSKADGDLPARFTEYCGLAGIGVKG